MIADRVPAIAQGFTTAHLSARRYLQLSRTLNNAFITDQLDRLLHHGTPTRLDTTSVIGKNVAFIRANRSDFDRLVALSLDVTTLQEDALQDDPPGRTVTAPRLTVRPRTMANSAKTTAAGLTELAGFPGYFVYVPQACVGKRCPLVLVLPGGGGNGKEAINRATPFAKQYGIIVLAANARVPGQWDLIKGNTDGTVDFNVTTSGIHVTQFTSWDVPTIDSALHRVLATHAIIPEQIGLLGFSDGGSYGLFLGRNNQDVFSRVAALSALVPFDGGGPAVPTTQFFLSAGVAEKEGLMVPQTLRVGRSLQQAGHPVTIMFSLRTHFDMEHEDAYPWRWLAQSWAKPAVSMQPTLPADSDAILTLPALQHMTAFWTRFMQEPSSVIDDGRIAHEKLYGMAIGNIPVSVLTIDMPALAAAYPSVAADLKAAGLTAVQEDAYRRALLRVKLTDLGRQEPDGNMTPDAVPMVSIAQKSVLEKNLAFRAAHAAAFAAFAQTRLWTVEWEPYRRLLQNVLQR
jgi:predicted esterase